MSYSVNCDGCNLPMLLVKKGKSKTKYRIRRFYCEICDIATTIYSDGGRDLVYEPANAILEVNEVYKQEKEARNYATGNK